MHCIHVFAGLSFSGSICNSRFLVFFSDSSKLLSFYRKPVLSAPYESAWCFADPSPRISILYTLKSVAILTLASMWQLESWGLFVPLVYWPWFLEFPHSATHIQKLFICLCVLLAVSIPRWPIFARMKCLSQQGGFTGPCWAGVLTP